MPINQPYDPRYNAKIYVPKLTEEERRAHATPLENLRSLRFRTQVPATPSPVEAVVSTPTAPRLSKAPTQIEPAVASPGEAPTPVPVPPVNTTELRRRPSPAEVVFAEFPELYPERCGQVHGNTHRPELCLVGAADTISAPACAPCTNQTQSPPRYPLTRAAREGDREGRIPFPLLQSFRFGSRPGAPPHTPPA